MVFSPREQKWVTALPAKDYHRDLLNQIGRFSLPRVKGNNDSDRLEEDGYICKL